MGTYLCCGVVVRINIRKKNGWCSSRDFNLFENKKNIEEGLKKFLDMSIYEYNENSNGIYFTIKRNFFDKNIYALLREIDAFNRDYAIYNVSTSDEVYYPIHLKIYDENYPYRDEWDRKNHLGLYYIEESSEKFPITIEYDGVVGSEYHIFSGKMKDEISSSLTYVRLWLCMDKISSEDNSHLIRIINKVSRGYFKSPLGGNVLFFITE